MLMKRCTRSFVFLAIIIALLLGACGAPNSKKTVSAQENTWQIYRVETSPDGTLYVEVHENGFATLVREDGEALSSTVVVPLVWSAASEIVINRNDPQQVGFYRFSDLLCLPGCNVVHPFSTLHGSYLVWDEPFQNGDFLMLNRETQEWQQVAVDSELEMYQRRDIGGEDLYPSGIIGNELGYMLGSDVMIYSALTGQSRPSPVSWPLFNEDTIEVTGLGGQPDYTITHYQVVAETDRWKFITGLVNDQLEAGVYYSAAGIEYWLGSTVDPMSAQRLVTARGNNLIIADVETGEISECQIEAYGINCAAIPFSIQ